MASQNFSAQMHTLEFSIFKPKQKCSFDKKTPLAFDSRTQDSLVLWRVNLRALALNEHNMREHSLQFYIKVAFFSPCF